MSRCIKGILASRYKHRKWTVTHKSNWNLQKKNKERHNDGSNIDLDSLAIKSVWNRLKKNNPKGIRKHKFELIYNVYYTRSKCFRLEYRIDAH